MLLSQGSEFKLYYGGEQHHIDANTFVNSLIHNINLIEEINRNTDLNKKIDIKVKAPEKGSFVIEISIQASNILEELKGLFTSDNVEYAANLIGVIAGLYGAHQFLKGKNPTTATRDDNAITITNNENSQITISKDVYNIYINKPIIKEIISKNFETLEKDENIENFQIINSENEVILSVPNEEFSELSENTYEEEEVEKSDIIDANLKILRPSFEKNLKSDFYWEGIKINAKIQDEAFMKRIDEGESFAKGDYLVVKLKITKRFDESVDTYINKSYTIIEVFEHKPRGNQTSFS